MLTSVSIIKDGVVFKKVYLYDKDGLLIPFNNGQYNAQKSPNEDNVYLIPENSTELEPTLTVGTWPVFVNGAWVNELDFRNEIYYDSNGNSVTITTLGPIPAGLTTTPPPLTQAALLKIFLSEIQTKLTASDITMCRIIEAIALGENTWTSLDVIAYVQYRKILRNLLTSTVIGVIPVQPSYPIGT